MQNPERIGSSAHAKRGAEYGNPNEIGTLGRGGVTETVFIEIVELKVAHRTRTLEDGRHFITTVLNTSGWR